MTKIEQEIEDFKRRALADRLALVYPHQRALFGCLYPNGVHSSKLESAIDLCDRTIRKNQADPERNVEAREGKP